MSTKRNRPSVVRGRAVPTTKLHSHYSTGVQAIVVRYTERLIVGYLAADVWNRTTRRERLQRDPSRGSEDRIPDAAARARTRYVEVDRAGRVYQAMLSDYRLYGFPVRHSHGDQRGLALTYRHVRRVEEPPITVRLSLFGGAR